MSKWSRNFWADLGERVGATFLEVLIPLVGVSVFTEFDWEHGVIVAGSAAGLAALKGLLANLQTPESGASLLPSPPGPEVDPETGDPGDDPRPLKPYHHPS